MNAILIDPEAKSIEYVQVPDDERRSLIELRRLVHAGSEGLDFAYPFEGQLGEMIIVGGNSALQDPPLKRFTVPGSKWPIYGRAVLMGFNKIGQTRATKMTVDDVSKWIEFE